MASGTRKTTGDPQQPPAEPAWYRLSAAEVLSALAADTGGLSEAAAQARLQQHGPNELIEQGAKSPLLMLREQFTNVMVLILLAAAGLSLLLGKYFEAGAVLAIVVLFAVLGFLQEYRAERAIASLKKLAVPQVRVYRQGRLVEIASRDLVPGDVISLEAGNLLPADVRMLESVNLRVQEAALTGESEPVEKQTAAIEREVPLGDRRNMAYMGTTVSYGRGTAVVTATGMQTELGTIAGLLQAVRHDPTPLQQRLDEVGKQLAIAGVVVAVLIFAIGAVLGESLADMLLTAVSVAVAVIPEGLPAVVTFTLALGAQRMLRRNALIRKLPAVETLGSVTTICSDKTGTLTENRMTVTTLVLPGRPAELQLTPDLSPAELRSGDTPGLSLLLAGAALCNDALLQRDGNDGSVALVGDPTEGALLVAAARGGLQRDELNAVFPRVAELPFDSERKRMTTVHARPPQLRDGDLGLIWGADGYAAAAPYLAVSKGAVDGLLELTTHVWQDGGARPLDAAQRAELLAANDRLARDGKRVLGVAFRPLAAAVAEPAVEQELIFLGMLAMIDPPRAEVRDAVARCRAAGIRPIMITGDHPLTAAAIARELGISADGSVVTGMQLAQMSDAELAAAVQQTAVFARVSPEHKLKIVAALQQQGQVVAMTGDGVNDAPALKKADIGVAMGITGTDVSKEAAEMVLRDDNFATIVAAVEEGRVIYDNLRRFVKFAVAGNIGKVLVMLCWPLLFVAAGVPVETAVALLPLQLLWLNLMTDGLLGLSMGMEPAEQRVMQRPPHRPGDGIFAGGMAWQVSWVGAAIGVLTLAAGFWYYRQGLAQWQSLMFTALAVLQTFQALATRSNRESLLTIGVFSNRAMWAVIALLLLLQAAVLYTPLAALLGLLPLTAADLLFVLGLGLLLFSAIELEKLVLRRRTQPVSVLR
jgi:P-type Ca2+ transporter type 2C